jgi:uncharacterized protein YjbI with pentapeptide repeats
MNRRLIPGVVLSAGLLLSACGGGEQATLATDESALETANGSSLNGSSLNGSSLNGSSLNGSSLNGSSLNGVSLSGASLNGAALSSVKLSGSQLLALSKSGSVIASGAGMVGAQFDGQLSTGGVLPLRIDKVARGSNANSDVWFYSVSYQTADSWRPLCGVDSSGSPIQAVAVLGTWDTRQRVPGGGAYTYSSDRFSLGCRGVGAIAKCVEIGYKPWKTASNGASLRDHHAACTRMIRADYCGDGEPHTVNGRSIDVYDGVGVLKPSGGLLSLWLFEAEWSSSGARCISLLVNDRYLKAGLLPPHCFLGLVSLSCGANNHFNTGSLVMNRDHLL